MDDRSLLSASLNKSDVVESQYERQNSNSISQFIYARLDVVIKHCRYQRYKFVSFEDVFEILIKFLTSSLQFSHPVL